MERKESEMSVLDGLPEQTAYQVKSVALAALNAGMSADDFVTYREYVTERILELETEKQGEGAK